VAAALLSSSLPLRGEERRAWRTGDCTPPFTADMTVAAEVVQSRLASREIP
jgi:hypothetical protein